MICLIKFCYFKQLTLQNSCHSSYLCIRTGSEITWRYCMTSKCGSTEVIRTNPLVDLFHCWQKLLSNVHAIIARAQVASSPFLTWLIATKWEIDAIGVIITFQIHKYNYRSTYVMQLFELHRWLIKDNK